MLNDISSSVRAVTVLFASVTFAFSAQTQSPSLFAANAMREALEEHGVAPKMEMIPRTPREMRGVVSRCLGPRLLNQIQSVSGRDFQYQFGVSSRTAQLGVIVLRYPTAAVAKQMAAALAPRQNYFQNSKILTRFSAVPLGSLLVVSYSENSGDDRIVEALDNLPAKFEKASGIGAMPWGESETVNAPQ